MKKIIAVLAFIAMLCSLTAFGYNTAGEITDKGEISETVLANGNYRDAIRTFLDCMNSHNGEGIMKMSYPDKYIDTMNFVMETNGETIEEKMDSLAEDFHDTVRLVDVVSEETLGDDAIEDFYVDYVAFQLLTDYIEENGKENIDLEKNVDLESLPEPYCKINDLCIVDCVLEYENENGGTLTAEQAFLMLDIDGEGWKTDISMIDFVKDAKQKQLDIISRFLIQYSNVVLTELDKMGVEIPEKCTICSDSSKNYNVSDEFLSIFDETLQHYNSGYKELDYVIEINNGYCFYAECTEKMSPDNLFSEDREHIITFGEYTFDDIYNLCSEEIQKLITKMKEVEKLW